MPKTRDTASADDTLSSDGVEEMITDLAKQRARQQFAKWAAGGSATAAAKEAAGAPKKAVARAAAKTRGGTAAGVASNEKTEPQPGNQERKWVTTKMEMKELAADLSRRFVLKQGKTDESGQKALLEAVLQIWDTRDQPPLESPMIHRLRVIHPFCIDNIQ
ncbi:uncharacterized protein LOC132197455 [Neocloeon triangulifer]|uniref:uncharacterized protein LOC132197455 n=1 Tax=Neocloeon triangulifer TaxID=2078957 RepID=UPI00286F93D8|nr:uncharacterized protein LOC132197455 [Neocloeon triangulifer]XP_059476736.1 uncharacterized protein LOC132197455 [Neocloeon triangulifer]XP_059476737.1 uncharacterized protein LOC132197455 [Neocloeon triangulifer]XP_059476738.1 uncharacterized protein LOC132197455 [Neocloeon triangulifer]